MDVAARRNTTGTPVQIRAATPLDSRAATPARSDLHQHATRQVTRPASTPAQPNGRDSTPDQARDTGATVLDGPASGEKGSKGGPYMYSNPRTRAPQPRLTPDQTDPLSSSPPNARVAPPALRGESGATGYEPDMAGALIDARNSTPTQPQIAPTAQMAPTAHPISRDSTPAQTNGGRAAQSLPGLPGQGELAQTNFRPVTPVLNPKS